MKKTEIPTALVGKLLGHLEAERRRAAKGLGRSREDEADISALHDELTEASESGKDHVEVVDPKEKPI